MTEIFMPKMGDAMTEGKVVRWYKAQGDPVRVGEALLEIETDKVNLDLEAEAAGTLARILVPAGELAPVGASLATILGEGETLSEAPAAAEVKPAASAPSTPATVSVTAPAESHAAPATPPSGRVRSSPLARKMARELGVDVAKVPGSGPAGRVVASDVTRAAEGRARSTAVASTPASERRAGRSVPLTAMRRTIAKRLVESIGPVPHFYLTIDLDVTLLSALRKQFNEIQDVKVSVNDFVIRAAALALREHPNVNASFMGDSIQEHGDIHVGVAVATPEGLLTPVVRDADRKSIPQIAAEVRDLAERARGKRLRPDEYQGSTFTISNLGMYGIEEFTAIINPPNSAILAVGAAMARPVVVDGQVVIRDRMKVTMSADHRVIDGASGAEYLRTFQRYIEQPLRLVVS